MRVNVSNESISKTFMYGLKVSLQRQLTKSNKKKSLEFYLNLDKTIKKPKTLFDALIILTEFATFASLLQVHLTPIVVVLLTIFISFNGFSRLTVLMNDFRLKTFYCKSSKSSKSNKIIKKPITTLVKRKTFSSNLKLKLSATSSIKISTLPTTSSSSNSSTSSSTTPSSAAAAAFATSATLLLLKVKSSKNNNHNRTYNNSSKSNKVFLYYTPRDPRLRILLKTKHFSNRPQPQQQSLFKVLSDLCNYGELIGGGSSCGEYNNKKQIVKQLNYNKNSANLYKPKEICDNLLKTSDNLIVATAACAANETTSAANILIVFLTVVVIEYAKELFQSIEILLSFCKTQQQLKIFEVKSERGLHESIL